MKKYIFIISFNLLSFLNLNSAADPVVPINTVTTIQQDYLKDLSNRVEIALKETNISLRKILLKEIQWELFGILLTMNLETPALLPIADVPSETRFVYYVLNGIADKIGYALIEN